MSAATAGGGMNDSDDDNGGGGRDKKGKGVPDTIPYYGDCTSDEEIDEEEVDDETKAKRRSTLDCLSSLESTLPMKWGLSSHYLGKSKSFGKLAELGMEETKDLGKKEHPVNKRRRLLIAHEILEKQLEDAAADAFAAAALAPEPANPDHPQNEEIQDEDKDNRKNEEAIDDKNDQDEDGNK